MRRHSLAEQAALAAAALLILAALPAPASAQAWTRDAGSFYVSLSHRYLAADEFYAPDGSTLPLASTYRQHSLGFYGEVGVVDRWLTVSADGELFRRNVLDDQGATTGLGDLRLGAWTGLLVAPVHLAFGVLVGVPTGDPTPEAGPGLDDRAQLVAATLPTGDGETDVALRLALGHSFGGGRWPLFQYVLFDVGYWVRTEGISDGLTYRAELGSRIARPDWDRILLILRLSGLESLGDGGGVGAGGFAGLGDGVSYTAYAGELAVRLVDTLHLGVGYESAFRAERVAAGGVLKLSLSWER